MYCQKKKKPLEREEFSVKPILGRWESSLTRGSTGRLTGGQFGRLAALGHVAEEADVALLRFAVDEHRLGAVDVGEGARRRRAADERGVAGLVARRRHDRHACFQVRRLVAIPERQIDPRPLRSPLYRLFRFTTERRKRSVAKGYMRTGHAKRMTAVKETIRSWYALDAPQIPFINYESNTRDRFRMFKHENNV